MGQPTSDSEWTKEKVVKELKRKKEELGKSPSKRDVDSLLAYAARKLFDSWNRAKEEAGLETFEFGGKGNWSKERVISKLKELADELERSPVSTDNPNLAQAAHHHFGSWNDAKRAAGLRVFPSPNGRDWSKKKVIQELKSLAKRAGRVPKKGDDQVLKRAACRQFESWNRALEAAGVDSMEPREDSIPIALSKWEDRKELLEETVENVKNVLPSDSISDIEEDATNLLCSIESAGGYSLRVFLPTF